MFKLKQLYLFISAIKVTVTNVAALDNSKTSLGEAAVSVLSVSNNMQTVQLLRICP